MSYKGKERAKDVSAPSQSSTDNDHKATCIIIIGMAGSGKTTLVQRLNSHLHTRKTPPYLLNLDPAVRNLPYQANIDIRDTINYKEVMKQYNLGPNGGILTALNLFTTKFDQVLGFMEKRATTVDYLILDTPGQIEIFTWSASGAIITDAIAASIPCCVAYVVDTARTTAPATFMSNMLYACSILYKTKLPFILVFNKTDVQSHAFAVEWMRDFEAFQAALAARQSDSPDDGPAYMMSLMNSMSLVLDEFYKHLRAVGVSALTGDGMDDFFNAVAEARKEYESDYKPELDRLVANRDRDRERNKQSQLDRLMKDMNVSGDAARRQAPQQHAADSEDEVEDDDYDDDDGEIMDPPHPHFLDVSRRRKESAGVTEDEQGGRWPAPGGR